MILTGLEIEKQIAEKRITIDPFDPRCVNPVSVDFRLGRQVAVYFNQVDVHVTSRGIVTRPTPDLGLDLDAKAANSVTTFNIPGAGLVIVPGVLYLMCTQEVVSTMHYVPVLDGKSSIGRLGIKVHETAGYCDPGFHGQVTLEVTCVQPVRIYAGMRFCQMRFHTMEGELAPYGGHSSNYKGATAQGPVASMSWRQFEQDASDGSETA